MSIVKSGLLLWRVETLESLTTDPSPKERGVESFAGNNSDSNGNHSPLLGKGTGGEAFPQQLAKHCEEPQLYLQQALSLSQLSAAVGVNRYYLGQYFASQGMNYYTYIHDLRIRHFISRYRETCGASPSSNATAKGHPTAQQLARESGYHSYSTFSTAFKQRMGQSVTSWMRQEVEAR